MRKTARETFKTVIEQSRRQCVGSMKNRQPAPQTSKTPVFTALLRHFCLKMPVDIGVYFENAKNH
jgi:hypothetical protein